jgi:hypothetical protein
VGGTARRAIEVGTDTCLLGFSGRSYIKSQAFAASTLSPTGGVNEIQTVSLTGTPTTGTFTLKYRGQETATIAYNAAASAVQTALRALANIGASGVSVSGAAPTWSVTFTGPLGNTDVFLLQVGTNALSGGTTPGVAIAQLTAGVTNDPRIQLGSPTLPGTIVTQFTENGYKKVREYTAAGGVKEVQTISVTGTPTGGVFRLAYRGGVTGDIAYNASAAAVAAALNALDSVDEDGGVTATGGALPGTAVVVTFDENGARASFTLDTNALTGGTTPTVGVAETTAGADAETIYGIVDGQEEFIVNSTAGDRDVAVYKTYLVLDAGKIKNFSTHQDALLRWCKDNYNRVETL